MVNRHESVTAVLVGFVVVGLEYEAFEATEPLGYDPGNTELPPTVVVYQIAKEAIDATAESGGDKSFGRQLQLPDGSFVLVTGINEHQKIGSTMYGVPCSECGRQLWTENPPRPLYVAGVLCWRCNDIGTEPFSWAEHEANCDGCTLCNPTAFREEY
jgi:hypothetical protein